MNKTELIRQRRSVRTFDGNRLRPEDALRIMDFAQMVENPFDIPVTWRLLDAKKDALSSPVITGALSYIGGKVRPVEHAEEAFGYTFEKILLYALELGIGSTWIAGTMDRPAFERAMTLVEDEIMPCISPLGYPAKKMSLRETLMRKGVKADVREPFETLFFDSSFETPLTEEKAGVLKTPLEMVRLAPSAVNKQPWRVVVQDHMVHFYECRSRGFVDKNGWDIQKIDMGIALCHFELAAIECGLEVSFRFEDPGLTADENMIYTGSFAWK